MSVILGGVELDPRLILRGVFDSPQIITKVERTLTGVNVPVTRPTPGRTLELTTEGPNNTKYGLFTRAQLIQLATVRDQGLTTTLIYNGTTHNVFIPHDSIQTTSVTEITPPKSTDLFIGSIRLIEV